MNDIYDSYHTKVFEIYNLVFPLVSKTIKTKQATPWMSFKLKQCVKKKAKLYKLYLRGRVTKAEYTQYKNRLTNVIRRTKALYYAKLFSENAGNPKKIWSTINNLLNRKVTTVLNEMMVNGIVLKGDALANHVNNYFVNIAATIQYVLLFLAIRYLPVLHL